MADLILSLVLSRNNIVDLEIIKHFTKKAPDIYQELFLFLYFSVPKHNTNRMVQHKDLKKELLFRLGLPKTSPTFLHGLAFPKFEGIQYFRKRKFNSFK